MGSSVANSFISLVLYEDFAMEEQLMAHCKEVIATAAGSWYL